jgi:hypothetical protein
MRAVCWALSAWLPWARGVTRKVSEKVINHNARDCTVFTRAHITSELRPPRGALHETSAIPRRREEGRVGDVAHHTTLRRREQETNDLLRAVCDTAMRDEVILEVAS